MAQLDLYLGFLCLALGHPPTLAPTAGSLPCPGSCLPPRITALLDARPSPHPLCTSPSLSVQTRPHPHLSLAPAHSSGSTDTFIPREDFPGLSSRARLIASV